MDDVNEATVDPQEGIDQPPEGDPLDTQIAALQQQYPDSLGAKRVQQIPVPPKRPAGFGSQLASLWKSFSVKDTVKAIDAAAGKTATAIERGAADFVDDTSNAVVGAGGYIVDKAVKATQAVTGSKAFGSDWETWYNSGDTDAINPIQIGEQRKDAMFGQKQGGFFDFVEGATAFTGALVAGNEATGVAKIATPTLRFLTRVGLQGLATAAATDPRAARLSDMVENGPPSLTNPLTRFLRSNGQDSEALARLKSGLEGSMTGAAIDSFIAGIKPLASALRGVKAGAASVEAEASALARAPEPVKVTPLEGGGFTLERTVPAETHALPKELAVIGPAPASEPALIFDSRADAESHAAALNESITTQAIPEGHIDEADIAALNEAVKNAPENAKLEDVLPKGLFNYNYFGGTDASKAVIETLAQRFTEPVVGLKNRAVDGLGVSGSDLLKKAQALVKSSDAESWMSGAVSDADALPEIQARQVARKIVLKSMAGRVADLSKTLDTNPANVVAFENMKAAANQLLHLAVETSGVDSGAGRLLQSLKNSIPNVKNALKDGVEAVSELSGTAKEEAATASKVPSAKGLTDEPDNLLAPPEGAGNAKPGDRPVTVPREENPLTSALTPDDWRQMARQIRLAEGNPALVLDAMLGRMGQRAFEHDPSKWELFNAFRANMMLSGPKTMIVNTMSNAIAAFQAPLEYWTGGTVTGNSTVRQQGADMLAGMFENSRQSWRVAAKAWRLGDSILDVRGLAQDMGLNSVQEMAEKGGALGFLAKFDLPGRILMTTDEYFKNLNYLNSVRGLSMRAAREDIASMGQMTAKETGDFMANRLADDLAGSVDVNGSALNPVALNYARDATFQTELTGKGKTLQEAVQKHPSLRLILPFVRTPINLMRYAWQRTPILGALAGDMAEDLAAGGDRAAVALGKQTMGAAVWSTATMLAVQGRMTGAGPSDPQLRQQWLDAGNQPYSVRLPGSDSWISYRRIDQLGTPLGLVADVAEMSGEMHETDTQNVFGKFLASISANLTSKTFLGGLANFFDAVHSGDENAMNRMLESEIGSVLPAALRQVDPNDGYSEVRGYLDSMKERLPGLSGTLESRRNILGEKVMKAPGYLNYSMNPFTIMPGGKIDHVQDTLVELGKGITMPADVQNGVDLTDRGTWKRADGRSQSPYDRMLELMGTPTNGDDGIRAQLTDLINSESWKDAGAGTEKYKGGARWLMASKTIQGAQKSAFDTVLREYPGLEKAMEDAKGERKEALDAPPKQSNQAYRPQFLSP